MNSSASSLSVSSLNNLTISANSAQKRADYSVFEFWLTEVVFSALILVAVFGSLGNTLTIRTFHRMGMLETPNLTLAWLAASDLCFLVSEAFSAASMICIAVEMTTDYRILFPVDPRAFRAIVDNMGSAAYANTILITTFVTVTRCLIVATPLRFRRFLSWQTTSMILSIFSVICIASMTLLLAFIGILPQFDPRIGTVRPLLWVSPKRQVVKEIIYGLRDAILPLASQICVSVCAFVMVSCLREASRFRLLYTTTHNVSEANVENSRISTGDTREVSKDFRSKATRQNSASTLRGKELKIVRQISIIAAVFCVCNLPKVIANFLEIYMPGFYVGQHHHVWYTITQIVRELCQSVNATANFCIHWRYNTRFRQHCLAI